MISEFATLFDLLERRAGEQAHDRAYVLLSDRGEEVASLTFAELHRRAKTLACQLLTQAKPGDRVLLLFLSSLDFIVALFACFAAGLIAVPMMVPRRTAARDESASIVADCAPCLVLTNRELASSPRGDALRRFSDSKLDILLVDGTPDAAETDIKIAAAVSDVALLQYTSGSTSLPKGVVVSHANLLANMEMMRGALATTSRSTFVSWLPMYHDMGLILAVLNAIYAGAMCVLMAPVAFVQRPITWLRAIDRYRAEIAGAPNFGYDLCVDRLNPETAKGLDLSCWRVAFNASEPVRHQTLERFASAFAPYGFDRRALYPCYGLAEATLLVSAGPSGAGAIQQAVSRSSLQLGKIANPLSIEDTDMIVSCGVPFKEQRLAVVDPDTAERLGTGNIGEIWVNGPSICRGYWQDAKSTAVAFAGTIAGENDDRYLRTGDLGFIDACGELFITGRIKDVIIIRGMNYYPQDIEATVQGAHPSLRRHCGVAFAVTDEQGREAIAIVQEVERTHRNRIEIDEIAGLIRDAVFEQHELAVRHVLLARPGAVPKTTSGKLQRSLTRRLWREGQLDLLS